LGWVALFGLSVWVGNFGGAGMLQGGIRCRPPLRRQTVRLSGGGTRRARPFDLPVDRTANWSFKGGGGQLRLA
jgi:hypothetical protein